MNAAPTYLLEPLASLEEQRRYITGGTTNEYSLPDELIHDAFRFCEHFERTDCSDDITAEQRAALDRLREALDRLGRVPERYDRTNISKLIEHDEGWAVIRQRANEALKAFSSSAA